MTTFKIEFDMSNAAFDDFPATECCRILNEVAECVREGEIAGPIFDHNGNKIGQWAVTK